MRHVIQNVHGRVRPTDERSCRMILNSLPCTLSHGLEVRERKRILYATIKEISFEKGRLSRNQTHAIFFFLGILDNGHDAMRQFNRPLSIMLHASGFL